MSNCFPGDNFDIPEGRTYMQLVAIVLDIDVSIVNANSTTSYGTFRPICRRLRRVRRSVDIV